MRGWLLAGASLGLCMAAAVAAAVLVARSAGPLAHSRDVVIPRGGVTDVAGALREAGAIDWKPAFEALVEATSFRGRVKAGEFHVPARASLLDILAILRTARPVEHLLTIPEGLTAAQVARILLDDRALAGDLGVPAEGSVLPQSYAFERGASRNGLLLRAEAAARAALEEAWKRRTPDAELASPAEAVILASVVERETAIAAERPLVARVFLNRLHQSMRLQSDPTVVYGLSGGLGFLGRPLTRTDLQEDGPYNTYLVKGLPGGAICNPGVASLDAVLHPASSEALYFVADGIGGHRFADSLEEHERNVRLYRAGRSDLGMPK
jgi:UPF0755 protein